MKMQEYEILAVGQRFPDERYINKKTDAVRLRPHENFADAIISLTNLRRREVDTLIKGAVRYGLFVFDSIPFLILKFFDSELSFDFSMNIYGIKEEYREDWLNSEMNALTIVPIEAETGIIRGLRLIPADPLLCSMMKMACRNQLDLFRNAFEVDSAIVDIQGKFNTEAMFQGCTVQFTKI